MNTVHTTTPPRKAFFAHLYDAPGLLFQHSDGRLLFLEDATDRLTTIEPEMCPFLVTLGETALANTQRLADLVHGGHAAIACHRDMAVA